MATEQAPHAPLSTTVAKDGSSRHVTSFGAVITVPAPREGTTAPPSAACATSSSHPTAVEAAAIAVRAGQQQTATSMAAGGIGGSQVACTASILETVLMRLDRLEARIRESSSALGKQQQQYKDLEATTTEHLKRVNGAATTQRNR